MIATYRTLFACSFLLAANLTVGCSAAVGEEVVVDNPTDEGAEGAQNAQGAQPAQDAQNALATSATAYCPAGSTYDLDYRLCVTETEALGPFPPKMVTTCEASGGGEEACASNRWAVALARGLRGKAACPPGTSLDKNLGYCAEGDDIYGPFSVKDVEACKTKKGGAACESQRWARSMVSGTSAPARTYPYFYQYNNANEPSATCGITSAAMLLKYWAKAVTPDTLYSRFGKAKGQSPPGLESLYEAYGLYAASTYAGTEAMLKRQLDAGRVVVVHGSFTKSGHIMLVTGYNEKGSIVNDPAGLWAGCDGCGYPNRTSTNGRGALYGYAPMRSAMYGEGTLWMSTADTKPFTL